MATFQVPILIVLTTTVLKNYPGLVLPYRDHDSYVKGEKMDTKMVTQPKTQTALRVPCEVYSRIVGYLRPVQNWNAGKKQEFKDRKTFIVKADNKQ